MSASATNAKAKVSDIPAKVEKSAEPVKTAAKGSGRSRQTGKPVGLPDMAALFAVNTAQMEAFFRANEALLDGLTSMQSELLNLADRRMKAMDEWTRTVATSNGYSRETIESQFAYARRATEQYFETTRNLLKLGSGLSTTVLSPIEQSIREVGQLHDKT